MFTTECGAEMKLFRYGLVCLICGLSIFITGCQKDHVSVVNTKSGIVIHSSDFTNELKDKAAKSAARIKQETKPTAKSSGNVIKLGDGYEKVDLGPIFDI